MAVYEEGFAPSGGASRSSVFVNYAGAALSLILILGIAFWGYKLIMRDVSGIPVVRAMEGDMRVLPNNPGGEVAPHTGLSVNEVAAVGEAGGPEDRLVLAPATSGLSQEDLEVQPTLAAAEILSPSIMTDAPELTSQAPAAVPEQPLTTDDVLAIIDEIASEADAAPAAETTSGFEIIPASVPGVSLSLRPLVRPASLRAAPEAVTTSAPEAGNTSEVAVTTAAFPSGTNLVQLGAFTSPALAASAWERMQDRFGPLMANRFRVIQVSNQSTNTWYRLRASGFDDRAEAKRFCAALEAEGADCIAVVVD